ncbi:glucosyltransferase domain-containing protein [Acetobacter cerevisiae]|uniref:glucosyltransferase domain-containing protein n=1 Tax=Acetobacter cerevisiae TaxID=178900 RepID=UPI0009EE036B|nr:glucosyltransferase domain-containing protein [Acetobacter cerevisiae]
MKKWKICFFNNKIEFILLLLIGFIYILPRILSNSDYNDDIFRSTTGDANWWYYNGRPLNVWLMRALNQNVIMADCTPIPLILGATFFVFCCIIIIRYFLNGYNPATKVILCAAFIINPFFISNIFYKYDSLPMYMALILSIISVFINRNRSNIFLEILRSLLIIAMLCFYQAALSLVFSLIAIDVCVNAINAKLNIRSEIYRLATIFLSYIIYSKIIAPHYIPASFSEMSQHIPLNREGISILKNNIKISIDIILDFYHTKFMHLLSYFYFFVYLLGFLFIFCKNYKTNRKNMFLLLGAYFSGICIILFCTLGLTVFLKNPDIKPRMLLGSFSFILSAPLFLICISRTQIAQFLAILLCIGQIIPALSLSYSFGNYITQASTHDEEVLRELEFHLTHYITNSQTKITLLNDNTPTLSMKVKENVHPLIRKFMAIQGFGKNYTWYTQGFFWSKEFNYEIDQTYHFNGTFKPDIKTCHVNSVFENNHVIVEFQPHC